MTRFWSLILVLAFCAFATGSVWSQDAKPETKEKEAKDKDKPRSLEDETPVVTHHKATINGKSLEYTATVGMMPLRDLEGKTEARIFYMAYTLDGVKESSKRPLLFSFNGGPGSASVWLHMGALGPKRVVMPDGPTIPAPPYTLVDNNESWLDKTDIVFIDPVETGFSRAAKAELAKKFHGLRGDIESVGEFIRMYLTRNARWMSPLFVVGESYGTTRAAGLSGHLADKGIALNGVILVSTILDFETARIGRTNELPYSLFLPSFTATAWYHKKLPTDLQEKPLAAVFDEANAWALGEYQVLLEKGDRLTPEERTAALEKLARYTGLSKKYLDLNNLRVSESQFGRELMREEHRGVGRYDSRYLGIIENPGTANTEFDPSYAAVQPAYTQTFNQYVRTELGFKTDEPYHVLGGGRMNRWDFGMDGGGYPETSSTLRQAMAKNPHMKVLFAAGYYDLATPYAAVGYTTSHMRIGGKPLTDNISVTTYEAGHMMYLHKPSLEKLKVDVSKFLDDADGL